MKNYNKILEAINHGIQFALDDFEPEDIQISKSKQETISKEDSLWKNLQLREHVVDLGLPSGTLWCKYNLGCDYDLLNEYPEKTKAEQWYGDYYAWGETHLKHKYEWDNYVLGDAPDTLIKYCMHAANGKNNFVDGLTELQLEDDAAYQNMHYYDFKFCLPSKNQFKELLKYTTYAWIDDYKDIHGLNGILFKSKINGKELFFPAAGSFKYDRGVQCEYWSSTLISINKKIVTNSSNKDESGNWSAFALLLDEEESIDSEETWVHRCEGLSIRPILKN